MLLKLIFVLALLFGVSAAPITASRPRLGLHLHRGTKISALSGEPLIQAACKGIGEDVTECVSTLQSASEYEKADANRLAYFTLRFVETHAENITAGIKDLMQVPDVAPMLQSAIHDCLEQYNSIDDLIENAEQAVEANNYADAQQFIFAAISNIELCDSVLRDSNSEENLEGKTGETVDMGKDLKEYNLHHKNLLAAALNILTVD